MIKRILKWKALTQAYHPGLKETLFQHYYGAQFIAMAGRLIKQRDDDSNTSMVFDPERQSSIGTSCQNACAGSRPMDDARLEWCCVETIRNPLRAIHRGTIRKSSFLFQFRASYYSGTTKSFQIMTDVLLI